MVSKNSYYQVKWEAYRILAEHQDRSNAVIINDVAIEKLMIILLNIPFISLPTRDNNFSA
ncbi:TPA: hypothetical protein ENX78_08500 [Candidatus Poribacteria bacterium]|nr:hypothetical protein [Candidatus Poribacteria bacterium]